MALLSYAVFFFATVIWNESGWCRRNQNIALTHKRAEKRTNKTRQTGRAEHIDNGHSPARPVGGPQLFTFFSSCY